MCGIKEAKMRGHKSGVIYFHLTLLLSQAENSKKHQISKEFQKTPDYRILYCMAKNPRLPQYFSLHNFLLLQGNIFSWINLFWNMPTSPQLTPPALGKNPISFITFQTLHFSISVSRCFKPWCVECFSALLTGFVSLWHSHQFFLTWNRGCRSAKGNCALLAWHSHQFLLPSNPELDRQRVCSSHCALLARH